VCAWLDGRLKKIITIIILSIRISSELTFENVYLGCRAFGVFVRAGGVLAELEGLFFAAAAVCCVCVRDRERVCVCERDRERESVCV